MKILNALEMITKYSRKKNISNQEMNIFEFEQMFSILSERSMRFSQKRTKLSHEIHSTAQHHAQHLRSIVKQSRDSNHCIRHWC